MLGSAPPKRIIVGDEGRGRPWPEKRPCAMTKCLRQGITALLVVDPYNDFISEGGKIWPRIKAVAEANNCVPHMLEVLTAAREAKLRIFFAMHHRYRPGDYENWKFVAPIQRAAWHRKSFEFGTWGGEFRAEFVPVAGEIVAQSTGAPAASPTQTSISNSSGTVSRGSS